MSTNISRRTFLGSAMALTASGFASAPSAFGETVAHPREMLKNFANGYVERAGEPGISCCLVLADGDVERVAAGYAGLESGKPMTSSTIQNIASISKTVTATAAMQLVESGDVGLEDDISEHLPFPVRNPKHPDTPITVKQLLTHTSTIRDGSAYGESYSCGDPTIALKDWIFSVVHPEGDHYSERQSFLRFEPGDRESYSNIGYGVLGLLVETVAQQPFNEFTRDRILKPLEMNESGWRLDEIDQSNHATMYTTLDDDNDRHLIAKRLPDHGFAALCPFSFPNYPDGLLRTSVKDFAKFMQAFLNEGEGILKPETVKLMLSPHVTSRQGHIRGLCWGSPASTEGRVWGHSGGDPGTTTVMAINPSTRRGSSVFTNGPGHQMIVDVQKRFVYPQG